MVENVNEAKRSTARALAQRHLASGDPLGWFEALYLRAEGDPSAISWADLTPNPNVVEWLDTGEGPGPGERALVIGCGLGDDAEELASRGYDTTAFDISPSAIAWCRRRFPDSEVSYVEADLFGAPAEWHCTYDLVVEAYTLQVLPPELRQEASRRIASFVGPCGCLLVVARGREPTDPEGEMPWPLTRGDLQRFRENDLCEESFEDYHDSEDPPVRRFRSVWRRESG